MYLRYGGREYSNMYPTALLPPAPQLGLVELRTRELWYQRNITPLPNHFIYIFHVFSFVDRGPRMWHLVPKGPIIPNTRSAMDAEDKDQGGGALWVS